MNPKGHSQRCLASFLHLEDTEKLKEVFFLHEEHRQACICNLSVRKLMESLHNMSSNFTTHAPFHGGL